MRSGKAYRPCFFLRERIRTQNTELHVDNTLLVLVRILRVERLQLELEERSAPSGDAVQLQIRWRSMASLRAQPKTVVEVGVTTAVTPLDPAGVHFS